MEKRIELERRARKANQVSFLFVLNCEMWTEEGSEVQNKYKPKKRAKLNRYIFLLWLHKFSKCVCVCNNNYAIM